MEEKFNLIANTIKVSDIASQRCGCINAWNDEHSRIDDAVQVHDLKFQQVIKCACHITSLDCEANPLPDCIDFQLIAYCNLAIVCPSEFKQSVFEVRLYDGG